MSTLDQPTVNQDRPSYSRIAINYGLIASMALIAISLVSSVLGFSDPTNPNMVMSIVISILSFGIIVAAMVMGISKHRDEDLGGYITFGRAFGLAFVMGLVIAIINTLFTFVYMNYIDPSLLESIHENFEAQMDQQGIGEGDEGYDVAKMFIQPGMIALFAALGLLIQNTIAALIGAAIGQKKQPQV